MTRGRTCRDSAAWGIAAFALGTIGCNGASSKSRSTPSAAVDAGATAESPPTPKSLPFPNETVRPACKVMSSDGGPAASADATRWIDLPAASTFTVRTLETGREMKFEGPGRVRACGSDVALVAEGAIVGMPGSAEAPGVEQWAATACGTMRWTSGVHRFSASPHACIMQSLLGASHVWIAEDVTVEDSARDGGIAPPWRRIDAKRTLTLKAKAMVELNSARAVKSSLEACERASDHVHELRSRMSTVSTARANLSVPAPDSGSLGELAAESVASRGIARAACAVAAVRIALAGSATGDEGRLQAALTRWRAPH